MTAHKAPKTSEKKSNPMKPAAKADADKKVDKVKNAVSTENAKDHTPPATQPETTTEVNPDATDPVVTTDPAAPAVGEGTATGNPDEGASPVDDPAFERNQTPSPAPAGDNANATPEAKIVADNARKNQEHLKSLKANNETAATEAKAQKELADRDLSDPAEVAELLDEVVEGLVSFSGPVRGALNTKPKAQAEWNTLVQKATALQGVKAEALRQAEAKKAKK